MNADQAGRGSQFVWLAGVVGLLYAGLIAYSQFQAFSWDESFHLLASALIREGKRPYLDFCFPQTPLNAYFYSGWMRVFGNSWRGAHVVAATLTAGAILLMSDYFRRRFPVGGWRLAGAVAVALLTGLNSTVVFFGTIAQAYALCLLLTVAAFRVVTLAVSRVGPALAALAGLLVSSAAASSLLTAPAVPVMLIWMLFSNRAGSGWKKLLAFLGAAIVPFLPVVWLFLQSPRNVAFNIAGYQLFGRRARWEGATSHDLGVLTSWVDSGAALAMLLLTVAGLVFASRRVGWPRAFRSELYLCFCLSLGMALEIGSAHPTFSWYFVLTVPFLAILAATGLYEISSRLYRADRPLGPAAALALLLVVSLSRSLHEDLEQMNWPKMETIARKIDEVTPIQGSIWAGEQYFFLTRKPVPEGMEFQAAQRLNMPMSEAAPLHILPSQELESRVKNGAFDTIENCDDDRIQELGLNDLYRQKADIDACTIFWDKKR